MTFVSFVAFADILQLSDTLQAYIWRILAEIRRFVLKQACFADCVQSLPDATPPTSKINQFRKTAIPFEPVKHFDVSWKLECPTQHSLIYVLVWVCFKGRGLNESMTAVFVEQRVALFGSAKHFIILTEIT